MTETNLTPEKEGKKKICGFRKFMLYFIGSMIALFILVSALGGNPEENNATQSNENQPAPSAPAAVAEKDLSIEAYVMSQAFMEDRLKAPSTAKYPWKALSVVKKENGIYEVSSYVDAENSFGAKIRTYYVATLQNTEGDKWKLLDLQAEE